MVTTEAFDVSNRAVDRFRAIRRIPLEIPGESLRVQLQEAAIAAVRSGERQKPPSWWSGECEYLLRLRGKGPDVFLVVRRDNATDRLVIVTVHSYEDLARFERRQAQATSGIDDVIEETARKEISKLHDDRREGREHQERRPLRRTDAHRTTREARHDRGPRFPRLERLLGHRIDDEIDLPAERFHLFVDRGIEEGVDIDFKSGLYPRKEDVKGAGERGTRNLASDVAALANTQGGMLVLGVREEDGVATELMPVPISDEETLRMERAIIDYIAPLPEVYVWSRRLANDPSRGFYVLAVPRSPSQPHAVRVGSAFSWFRRRGRQNYPLSETEIADAFRSRFSESRGRERRLAQIRREGSERIDLSSALWLTLSLVPNVPGAMDLTGDFAQRLSAWLSRNLQPAMGLIGSGDISMGTNVRRLTVSTWKDPDSGLARKMHAELHTDGCGFTAACLSRPADYPQVPNVDRAIFKVSDARLLAMTLDALRLTVAHACDQTRSYGDALVELRLGSSLDDDGNTALPIALMRNGDFGHELGRHRLRRLPPPSRHIISIDDILDDPRAMLIASRTLLLDLVQAFGQPDFLPVTTEGRLNLMAVTPADGRAALANWAATLGAETC